jgi:hypothetical protein
MQIEIFYTKNNADHLQAATFVKEAVRNLGISAIITERDSKVPSPRVVVNGYDLMNSVKKSSGSNRLSLSYEAVAKALERSAWSCI